MRPLIFAAAALGLVACAPEAPGPTTVSLNIVADASANGGAPTKVSVYYLSSSASFESGDYFQLTDDAQAALGADLVSNTEYFVSPGETQQGSESFTAPTPNFIGVVAGFRDVNSPGFKAVAPLTPNAPNAVNVAITGSTVTIN